MLSLTGKTALVTGASRGMGRASALALAAAGAQVLVHYGRGAKEADSVVAEIRKAGSRADAIATDLAAADGVDKLARQTRSIVGDRLDILVANAGVSKVATIEETTVEDFERRPFRAPRPPPPAARVAMELYNGADAQRGFANTANAFNKDIEPPTLVFEGK